MADPSVGSPGDIERPGGHVEGAAARPRSGDEGREQVEIDASPSRTTEQPGAHRARPQGMIPGRSRRRTKFERASMRVLATGGIVGLATLLGAVLVSQSVAGWIVGLATGLTSVILAALLWSSRQL